MNPHFYFPYRFGALPQEMSEYNSCEIVVFPIPYDQTTTYRPGARDGPRAIINASRYLEFYDEETGKNYSNEGICTLDELEIVDSSKELIQRIKESVTKLISDNKKIVMLGGEHSISFGAVQAFKEKYDNLSVLHIDAHADMRDYSNDNQFSHACVARRISEICPVTSVGIRSLSEDEAEYHKQSKTTVIYAKDMEDDSWMDKAIESLSDNVYITIDLDAFDISIMPSVGTPQPGGMNWQQMTKFLKKLSKRKKVVGFDVTELAPIPFMVSPDFMAAKLVYKMIGYFYK